MPFPKIDLSDDYLYLLLRAAHDIFFDKNATLALVYRKIYHSFGVQNRFYQLLRPRKVLVC
jgi:hypothetical protein